MILGKMINFIQVNDYHNNYYDRGLTALHWTAASPEAELLVPVLLARGSNIDARDSLGRTPLHFHSSQGRGFGVACLLHRGTNLSKLLN